MIIISFIFFQDPVKWRDTLFYSFVILTRVQMFGDMTFIKYHLRPYTIYRTGSRLYPKPAVAVFIFSVIFYDLLTARKSYYIGYPSYFIPFITPWGVYMYTGCGYTGYIAKLGKNIFYFDLLSV